MAEATGKAVARSRHVTADLQTQLLAQRTHLISELAGAIDNQFNNIMMAVSSYAELELKKAPPAARRSLEQVLKNAGQATYLIQKLLAFSRDRTPIAEALQINDVIRGLKDLLEELIGKDCELIVHLEADLPKIKADRIELEQLLLAMAIHAQKAKPGHEKLVLSTTYLPIDGVKLKAHEEMAADNGVKLSLCISEEEQAEQGGQSSPSSGVQDSASSLTLAAIERIVRETNGVVRADNRSGKATNFTIYFPAVDRDNSASEAILPEKSLAGSRTILVVEDDDAVRIPATEFLKMEGFKVLQARSGAEAINIAQQKRAPVDLLITDIVMPVMSGREVARELAEMCPGIKVLYMSGDAHQPSRDEVLQKPFRLDTLNEKIRSLLGD
jgi:two-component system, cell cycle sensor histidine kinase and response regulator CckA